MTFRLFWKTSSCGQLDNFWKNLGNFYSNIWSHWTISLSLSICQTLYPKHFLYFNFKSSSFHITSTLTCKSTFCFEVCIFTYLHVVLYVPTCRNVLTCSSICAYMDVHVILNLPTYMYLVLTYGYTNSNIWVLYVNIFLRYSQRTTTLCLLFSFICALTLFTLFLSFYLSHIGWKLKVFCEKFKMIRKISRPL